MSISTDLQGFFGGAGGKFLSAVEAHPVRSNQHEFNGVTTLKDLLGDPPVGGRRYTARFLFLDDDLEPVTADSSVTWYDARERHATRTECRLYYPRNAVMDVATERDYMLLAKPVDPAHVGELVVVVSPADSSVAAQLQVLFDLEPSARMDVQTVPSDERLTFTSRQLLEVLGFESVPLTEDLLGKVIDRFGESMPATKVFSQFARDSIREVDALTDPDAALTVWMDREESLYRTFEHHLLRERLFDAAGDVERTLEIAMQTFQRRRSRAGHALENHVAHILAVHGVEFDQQAYTEGRKRPDFLIPGRTAYAEPTFPEARLFMLGVKTTCKDRWRQVLTEADRIRHKHLLTLEAPISRTQTDEMRSRSLRLVVPRQLHHLFEPAQSRHLLSLAELTYELGVR